MRKDKPLKPEDFPVHTKQKEIVTDTGKPIAGGRDKETAEDVADRLNSDHAHEEQDRWAWLRRRWLPNAPEDYMWDEDDWDFAGADDAKVTIRAAVRYLLRGTIDGIGGDIVQEIITIVRQVSNEPASGQGDPLDGDMPGG